MTGTRWRRSAARSHDERGQSLIEFALTAPLLALVLLGLVEFGHGMNSYLTVIAAARDAARLGSQGGADESTMLTLVANETARLPSTLPASGGNCGSGEGVCIQSVTVSSKPAYRVRVCYDHPLIVGFPGISSIPMCSTTTMRIVQ